MNLTLTTRCTGNSAHVRVVGDLDYGTTPRLVETVSELLMTLPGAAELHLDFAELTFCDSAGLSGLLMIHRRTAEAGIHLHFDHRTAQLERILDITGLLELLTAAPVTAAGSAPANPGDGRSDSGLG